MKTYQEFYRYAKRLACKWRHSSQKIKEKLIYKGASPKMVESIIKSLSNDEIIDDEKSFWIDVFLFEEKRYGYRRVKEYLINKGYELRLVNSYVFNKEIEKDNCYYQFCRGINKYKNYKYSDVEREKLINYLKRYGFNDKMIYEIVRLGINYENVM